MKSAIRNQKPGNYPKRNKLHLEHGESLKTRTIQKFPKVENYYFFIIFIFIPLADNWATPSGVVASRFIPLPPSQMSLLRS